MKSLISIIIIASIAMADKNISKKQEKRQIPSYSIGGTQPSQIPQSPPVLVNNVPGYQQNYLPTCVVQPYGNSFYPNPSLPAYQPPYYNVPAESYVPQYPTVYQPPQYPASYQLQYPLGYQPQYPAGYQPQQQPQNSVPYSYNSFASTPNYDNNNKNNLQQSTKK